VSIVVGDTEMSAIMDTLSCMREPCGFAASLWASNAPMRNLRA
jgi:hypothetical protein